jgi:hypothetical protein
MVLIAEIALGVALGLFLFLFLFTYRYETLTVLGVIISLALVGAGLYWLFETNREGFGSLLFLLIFGAACVSVRRRLIKPSSFTDDPKPLFQPAGPSLRLLIIVASVMVLSWLGLLSAYLLGFMQLEVAGIIAVILLFLVFLALTPKIVQD